MLEGGVGRIMTMRTKITTTITTIITTTTIETLGGKYVKRKSKNE
jgi:hypothetical protein